MDLASQARDVAASLVTPSASGPGDPTRQWSIFILLQPSMSQSVSRNLMIPPVHPAIVVKPSEEKSMFHYVVDPVMIRARWKLKHVSCTTRFPD